MNFIGLLMVNEENDILERTLALHARFADAIYVLDGTQDWATSAAICAANPVCAGYLTDSELPRPPYPGKACDGYRQEILQAAMRHYGPDNWFMLLHADEVWTEDPRETVARYPAAQGFIYRLPFFFPHISEPWQHDTHPLDQLHWNLGPGWPEFRMFKGSGDVFYRPDQHFNVRPAGIREALVAAVDAPILHYPYRSPDSQRARAAVTFDPDNYNRARDGDVYWTEAMIAAMQTREQFSTLRAEAPYATAVR